MTKKPASADPRRIAYLPLQDLKVDPRNPRTHNEEQIGASIGRFGVLDLITLDERTGTSCPDTGGTRPTRGWRRTGTAHRKG